MGRSQLQRGDGADRSGRFGPDADDTGSVVLHVDMDAFFASVEVRRRPELRDQPVIVGGVGPRGVVSAASYQARRYGVHSAMPTARARRLCPHGVYLPPDLDAYAEASRAVMAIFGQVTPLVEALSLDEAFLDVSGCRRRLGSPGQVARLIRRRISDEQHLAASVGVAPTKFVAKLASAQAKPDGLVVVPAGAVLEFLHPLPVAALWGVGERTAETLHRLGMRTVADIAQAPPASLRAALGDAAGHHVYELASGRDPRRVTPESVDKSVGAETTFDVDVADPEVVRRTMLALSGKVAARLRRAGLVARTVVIKVRFADFRTVTRSRTVPSPTDVTHEVFDLAWGLYEALRPGERIRLIGVRTENLLSAAQASLQPTLGAREQGWREADHAADAARARFGVAAIRPASLLGDAMPHPGSGRPTAPDE
ncbi:MAG: DNA polymerase IV [Micromonosporaceae bacterium]